MIKRLSEDNQEDQKLFEDKLGFFDVMSKKTSL